MVGTLRFMATHGTIRIVHKPIFIIVTGEDYVEAKIEAISFLRENTGENRQYFDWYQGIKESGRWQESYSYFDTPRLMDDKHTKRQLNKMIKSQEEYVLEWIKTGNEELLNRFDNKGKEVKPLGSILVNFHIASSDSSMHIFDNSGYSGGSAVVDKATLQYTLKWAKKEKIKLWLVGFDVHY